MNSGWWLIVGLFYGWMFAPLLNALLKVVKAVFVNAYREYKKEANKDEE
ncbi:hypothetical protein ABEY43_06225 [Priestia megaterium]